MKHVQDSYKEIVTMMRASQTRAHGPDEMGWVAAHLAEETGEVAQLLKYLHEPNYYGKHDATETREHLADELVDVIGICASIANIEGLDLDAAMKKNHEKLRARFAKGTKD